MFPMTMVGSWRLLVSSVGCLEQIAPCSETHDRGLADEQPCSDEGALWCGPC